MHEGKAELGKGRYSYKENRTSDYDIMYYAYNGTLIERKDGVYIETVDKYGDIVHIKVPISTISCLSAGAQTYIRYYLKMWNKTHEKYIVSMKNSDGSVKSIARGYSFELLQEEYRILKCMYDIEKLDVDGYVDGKTLAVPAYYQKDTEPKNNTNNLCWATCTSMLASYYLNDNYDRTLYIAKLVFGKDYNYPNVWKSTDELNLDIDVSQTQAKRTFNIPQIKRLIDSDTPIGVLYRNDVADCGHWVLNTGYATATGFDALVVYNDPATGYSEIKTWKEFQNYGGMTWKWVAV